MSLPPKIAELNTKMLNDTAPIDDYPHQNKGVNNALQKRNSLANAASRRTSSIENKIKFIAGNKSFDIDLELLHKFPQSYEY